VPDPVINVLGLTKTYGEIKAASNLHFSLNKGELFCIVGPDGAGKTTTIRMLCGIAKPDSGSVQIMGYDLGKDIAAIKKHIGYLSQRFTLYGDLTVDENIEFIAEIHQVKNYGDRREELLDFTRLKPFRRRLAERLSGGMKQKLALACTLIHTPHILFLDEPTTGVDPVSRRDFWKILFRLLQAGITILMTTPYLDEAERGSRVALMHQGSFLIIDRPQAVKSLMKGTIIEVISRDARKAARVLKNMTPPPEVQVFGDRLHIVVQDKEKDFPAVYRRLAEEGIGIEHWREVPPSLENVFIALTRDSSLTNVHA